MQKEKCRKHNKEFKQVFVCTICEREKEKALKDNTQAYTELLKQYNEIKRKLDTAVSLLSDSDLIKME